jgi:hypothetical protein
MLTELGLYQLLGESPNRTWRFALPWVTPITNAIAPSWGYGHERVPLTGGAVIAANHLSEVDPAMVGIHCRRAYLDILYFFIARGRYFHRTAACAGLHFAFLQLLLYTLHVLLHFLGLFHHLAHLSAAWIKFHFYVSSFVYKPF